MRKTEKSNYMVNQDCLAVAEEVVSKIAKEDSDFVSMEEFRRRVNVVRNCLSGLSDIAKTHPSLEHFMREARLDTLPST